MDLTQLAAEAADLARTLDLSGTVSAGSLRRRIRRDLKTVCRTRQVLWEKSASLSTLPPAAEWLLDNHYLALREGREVLRALHRGRPLRGTADGECLLVRCAKGFLSAEPALTPEALGAWLTGFQKARPLTERELSLLLPCLVAVLTEQLASLCRDPESLLSGSQDPKPLESVFTALRSLSTVAWGPVLEQALPGVIIWRRPQRRGRLWTWPPGPRETAAMWDGGSTGSPSAAGRGSRPAGSMSQSW